MSKAFNFSHWDKEKLREAGKKGGKANVNRHKWTQEECVQNSRKASEMLSPEQRREKATKAIRARWDKEKDNDSTLPDNGPVPD